MIYLHRILCLLALLTLAACSEDPQALRDQRAALLRQTYKAGDDIHLGVVWSGGAESGFQAGAMLAAEELNAEGGIGGRRIVLKAVDETPFLARANIDRSQAEGRYRNAMQEAGTAMARAVLEDPRIGAVIGHSDTGQTTLSALSIYDAQGVLLLSAGTSDERVKWMGSELYFQLLPSDKLLVKKLVEEIGERRWDSVHLVYASNQHNEQVAELLKSELANHKISLAGSTALVGDVVQSHGAPRRLQNSLSELREGAIDAVLLLAPPEMGAQVMRYARSLGIAQPFIGTMSLDASDFAKHVREVGEDTLIASLYRDNGYLARRFAERFNARFPTREADKWAALGYDSVRLYAQAVACAETTDPVVVAHSLHFKLPLWFGLLGQYAFHPGAGENVGMGFHTKILRRQADGSLRFVFLDKPAADALLTR